MRLSLRRSAFAAGLAGLTACSAAPDLEDRVSPAARTAPFPDLVATAPIVAAHGGPVDAAPEAAGLQARADGLQRRAAALQRQAVIDAETLRRLNAAKAAAAAQ